MKHKTFKEIEMAARKQPQEDPKAAPQEDPKSTPSEPVGISFCEAVKKMRSGAKFKRAGWSKHVGLSYVEIRRGETIPVLSTSKHFSPYTPSIEDTMTEDWIELEEGGE